MNRGLATLVASLAMMDPDGIPPLPTRAERCEDRYPQRDDGRAEAKRARKAARRIEERDKTAFGRDLARARRMRPQEAGLAYLRARWLVGAAGESER